MEHTLDAIAKALLESHPEEARQYYLNRDTDRMSSDFNDSTYNAAGVELVKALEQYVFDLSPEEMARIIYAAPVALMDSAPFDWAFDDVESSWAPGAIMLSRLALYAIHDRACELTVAAHTAS